MLTGDGPEDYPAVKLRGVSDATFAELHNYTRDGFAKLKARARRQGLRLFGD
jgi:hypothetical protein